MSQIDQVADLDENLYGASYKLLKSDSQINGLSNSLNTINFANETAKVKNQFFSENILDLDKNSLGTTRYGSSVKEMSKKVMGNEFKPPPKRNQVIREDAVPNKHSKRLFFAQEILTTERTYLDSLLRLQKYYMQPLSRILSEQEIHRIFGNILSILRFSETLLQKLEKRMHDFDPSKTILGKIFIDLVPFLAMYLDYCCNYLFGMQLLQKIQHDNPSVQAVLDKASVDSEGKDVQDYCITPVQRIPRYRLLLENLLKSTPEDHPDYENLNRAYELVSEKAAEINRKMKLVEQQQKMTALYKRFLTPPLTGEDLVQPWRYLDSEFSILLYKTAGTNMNECVTIAARLYLFNDLFIISTENDTGKLAVITTQPLWNSYLKKCKENWTIAQIEVPPFQIVNPSGAWSIVIIDNEKKALFKTRFELLREQTLTTEKRAKRFLIYLYTNDETQEWVAVEPAPSYATNRVTEVEMEEESQKCTAKALETLLEENLNQLEHRYPNTAKEGRKNAFAKLYEGLSKTLTPKRTVRKHRLSVNIESPICRFDLETSGITEDETNDLPDTSNKNQIQLEAIKATLDLKMANLSPNSRASSLASKKYHTFKTFLPKRFDTSGKIMQRAKINRTIDNLIENSNNHTPNTQKLSTDSSNNISKNSTSDCNSNTNFVTNANNIIVTTTNNIIVATTSNKNKNKNYNTLRNVNFHNENYKNLTKTNRASTVYEKNSLYNHGENLSPNLNNILTTPKFINKKSVLISPSQGTSPISQYSRVSSSPNLSPPGPLEKKKKKKSLSVFPPELLSTRQ